MEESKTYNHPSYGIVSFSRTSHSGKGKRLFGSVIPGHSETITLRISSCEKEVNLSRNWFYPRKQIIEVGMSPAQFAELITGLNVGAGTPCTIEYTNGQYIEKLPHEDTESEDVLTGFKDSIKALSDTLLESKRSIENVLSQKAITKDGKDSIRRVIDRIVMEVTRNIPFIEESFRESTAKVSSAVKVELESFMTHTFIKAGMQLIANEESKRRLLSGETSNVLLLENDE